MSKDKDVSQLKSADLCYVNKVSAGRLSSPILGTYVSRDSGRYKCIFFTSLLKEPSSLRINFESIIEKKKSFHHQKVIKKCENVETVSVLSV